MAFRLIQAGNAAAVVGNGDLVIAACGFAAANDDILRVGVFDRVEHRFAHDLQRVHLLLRI